VAESTSKSESITEPKREPREPRALSTEYHKARKQLMLWSAVVFIWELVGIDLEKAKDAGGNFGAVIGAIKSPQAVPWALLTLVLYFAFKLRIEWRQCNPMRRKVIEAKQDYYSAFIVAFAAAALYTGQAISHVQLANKIQSSPYKSLSLLYGAMIGFSLSSGAYVVLRSIIKRKRNLDWFLIVGYFGVFIFVAISVVLKHTVYWWFLLGGATIGLLPRLIMVLLFGAMARRRRART
jgi:hypothetical protein